MADYPIVDQATGYPMVQTSTGYPLVGSKCCCGSGTGDGGGTCFCSAVITGREPIGGGVHETTSCVCCYNFIIVTIALSFPGGTCSDGSGGTWEFLSDGSKSVCFSGACNPGTGVGFSIGILRHTLSDGTHTDASVGMPIGRIVNADGPGGDLVNRWSLSNSVTGAVSYTAWFNQTCVGSTSPPNSETHSITPDTTTTTGCPASITAATGTISIFYGKNSTGCP